MGVKDLWAVLAPVCEKKSLWELENTAIAIDLSAWICDSNSVATSQQNMYLRNLFFRTNYLLLLGVRPVFVLEGDAPALKTGEIQRRIDVRRGGESDGSQKPKTNRSRLKSLQKQCVELLSFMGLECVRGRGEAEAFCAHLNQQGIVSGIVTQDSDVFLYGGLEVYRNFQMAPKFTVDCYQMSTIQEKLGLTRTKLVGFGILTGTDYNPGVNQVGKTAAIKYLTSVPDEILFQRFIDWTSGSSCGANVSDPKLENTIKSKALQVEGFPHTDVIAEFTAEPEIFNFEFKWSKPQLDKFIVFAVKKLSWEEDYAREKFLPLLGRWHLVNGGAECGVSVAQIKSTGKGRNSNRYKIVWNEHELVTDEPKVLVERSYPLLVESYEGNKKSKSKKKKTRLDVVQSETAALQDSIIEYNENDFNLSNIVEDFVSRAVSNPALL